MSIVTAFDTNISNTYLTYTNGNTSVKREGNVSCYPAALAKLSAEHSVFEIQIDEAPQNSNWLTFGLAKKDFATVNSDGFGREANSWGIADERSNSASSAAAYASSTTAAATLPRKLQQGDVLTAEVDTRAGWCEVRLNQTEFTHRFTIPVGNKEDYWFGATFASDHKITVLSDAATATIVAPAAAVAVPASASGPCLAASAFDISISNTELTYSSNYTTAHRVSNVSCYPAAFAKLPSEHSTFSVQLVEAPIGNNWMTFGIAKATMGATNSDGFGREANSWGIADERSSSAANAAAYASSTTAAATLPRKLQQGDLLTAEVDTRAGWCEVRLNQTEFTHRFTIPVGNKEDYWFGMTFASDHKVAIVAPGAAAAAPTVAAISSGIVASGIEWSADISNTALLFTNGNRTVMRPGSASSYPAAYCRLPSDHSNFEVVIDAAPIGSNWLTFGIAKKGWATSGSDGIGEGANSWGIVDDRSSTSKMPYLGADAKNVGTLPRKFKEGDHLTAEVDTRAGWCEVRLNQTEFTHRFTIPVGNKEDYWFGMTFANDHKVTIVPPGSTGAATVAAASPLAAAVPGVTGPGPTEWSIDISNTFLTFSNGNKSAKRTGGASSYPAAFARLPAEHCSLEITLEDAPLDTNWLTFGITKKGMAVSASDGMGRTAGSWGLVDDRSSSSTGKMAFVAADKLSTGSMFRKFKEGDVLTAEVDTRAGWCEVRLNQTEFTHRFTIPVGAKEDYWFGMTFANDHKATIGTPILNPLVASAVPSGSGPTAWTKPISNGHLVFSNADTSATRPGNVSSYPAAFAQLTDAHCTLNVVVEEAPLGTNWLTFGIAKIGMAVESSDGIGLTENSWGLIDDRSSGSTALPFVAASGSKDTSLARKLTVGDLLTAEVDTRAGWCEVRLNQTEFTHRFTIPVGNKEDYWFGMTFANDHKVTVVKGDGSQQPRAAAGAVTTGPGVTGPGPTEWKSAISDSQLLFTNNDKTVTRPGGASIYPAAFAPVTSEHCAFEVVLTTASISSNWLTFGIAKRGMAVSGSDGMGRTANSWGFADDRSSPSNNPLVTANKVSAGTVPRKFKEGDHLTAEVDTRAGWCEVRLNKKEFIHRFTIPAGAKEDYWFGMTFANDHQVTVVPSDESAGQEGLLAKALQQGSKQWKRSKYSLLGQGRAGKTAFANAVAGRTFEETASTVGINQLTCDVKHMQVSGGEETEQVWGECTKHLREYEAALAEILARKHREAQGKVETEKASAKGGDIRSYMKSVATAPDPSAEEKARAIAAASAAVEARPSSATKPSPASASVQAPVAHTQAAPVSAAVASVPPAPALVNTVQPMPVAKQEPVAAPKPELDEEMVMKMLATMQDAESGLLISLFDFGGQSVFEVIHHLFLTRNGVYALVFNMEWLLADGPEKDKALRFMRGWLSSIAVHTFNKSTQMTAPIVIVGTRLDTVTSHAAHEKISTTLHEHFSDNLAWRSVIGNEDGRDSNGKAFQWFYPVDNKLGKRGAAMKHLMSVVHGVIDKAEYTHKEVPLTWFKTIDQMADTKKDCLSLQEVMSTAGNCDVSALEVPLLLSFLHDMGHLMWMDEPRLRDVVILDPVSFLVAPATIIICKLTPDHEDTTHHFMNCHRECERMHKREWTLLKHDGVLNVKLLPILWEQYVNHTDILLQLMVKFGLLVPLRSESAAAVTQYLVPTLLAPAPPNDPNVVNWTDGNFSSCYFVFTLAEELGQSSTLTEADLKAAGFLPGGMFERIVGKALSWSQDTSRSSSINLQSVMLYKDMAVLAFGSQRFRLVHCADIHCVRVDVEGNNPVGIQQKLLDFIRRIVDECMKSLLCFPAVAFNSGSTDSSAHQAGLGKALLASELLIPLQQLRKAGKGESMLAWRGGRTLITLPEIKSKYGQWLQLYDLRDRYDVFISYRWGRFDSEFTEQLFDMFTNYSVSASSRAVEVFLDRKRLQEGRLFKSDFAAGLTHSLIALPVLSVDALARMLEHDPNQQDNVLLEWIMILESFHAGRILKVYPILFGNRVTTHVLQGGAGAEAVRVTDFFAEGIKDYLPKVKPTATLHQANDLLRVNGIEPSEKMQNYTVHAVVQELLQFLLCKASDFTAGRLVGSFADKVVHLLADCGTAALDTVVAEAEPAPKNPLTPSTKGASPVAHAHSAPVTPHSPVPAGGARTLKSLTVDEVGHMLATLGFEKIVPVFAANKISGKRLVHCEEFADLMGEDFGVTSKPMAKELLEQIEEWKEQGVHGL